MRVFGVPRHTVRNVTLTLIVCGLSVLCCSSAFAFSFSDALATTPKGSLVQKKDPKKDQKVASKSKKPVVSTSASKGKSSARAVHVKTPSWSYQALSKLLHAPSNKEVEIDSKGREMLRLVNINRGHTVTLAPSSDLGDFSPDESRKAAIVARSEGALTHPIEPRMLNVLYALQKHFRSKEIRIISAYRPPHNGAGSYHGYGRAIDLVVPGASDEDVAQYARKLGFSGVGIYPTSGFVHIDARDRSFFWVDYSGPGQKCRTTGILRDQASSNDVAARKRGVLPMAPVAIGSDVLGALRQRAQAVSQASTLEQDYLQHLHDTEQHDH